MAKAKDFYTVQRTLSDAVDSVFRGMGVKKSVVTAKDFQRIGLSFNNETGSKYFVSPNATQDLIKAFNIGLVHHDYSKFFKMLQKETAFAQRGVFDFQDRYNDIWAEESGKDAHIESTAEKITAIITKLNDKKDGGFESTLSSGKVKVENVWQLLSALAYSDKLCIDAQPSIDYLRDMQSTLLKNFYEKSQGKSCVFNKEYTEELFRNYGIDGENILKAINGGLVDRKIDHYGETKDCGLTRYDLKGVKNAQFTNVGYLSMKKAAMQVNSIIAEPFILEKLGLSSNPSSYDDEQTNPNVNVLIPFYKNESLDDVIGEKGRWTQFADVLEKAFNEESIKVSLKNARGPQFNISELVFGLKS